jgi:hypothetical protein
MIDLDKVAEEFVVPDYMGTTLANIPATVASLLGAPFFLRRDDRAGV